VPPSASSIAPPIARVTPGSVSTDAVAAFIVTAAVAEQHDTKPRESGPVAIAPRATSQALPLGRVSFDTASMVVSRKSIAAAILVRREDDAGQNAKIAWRTIDGSAVAGRDYGGPSSGEANFQEGQTLRNIYIPIVNRAEAAGDKSFVVELTGASPSAQLESTHRIIVVTIQGGG